MCGPRSLGTAQMAHPAPYKPLYRPSAPRRRSVFLRTVRRRVQLAAEPESAAAGGAPAAATPQKGQAGVSLDEAIRRLSDALKPGKDEAEVEARAVQVAEELKGSGGLRAYGGARSVPKRDYTLEELRLNKIEAEKFLAPEDTTLDKVRTTLQVAALAGLMAASFGLHWKVDQVIAILGGTAFLLVADQVANMGGVEALVVDTAARFVDKDYANRVALHEAGHFLTAYLVGLLPRDYCLSSLDAFRRYRVLNVQAGCKFCDGAFQREVASGKLKASSLERFACVALAGVATEYMYFGRAEGGIADVQQLDGLMRALGFSQKKADGEVRWAVLNTVELLRRHRAVHGRLADAMYRGEPVAECVRIIEDGLKDCEDV